MAQGVGGDDAADGADAVRGVGDLLIGVDNEVRCMDNFSPLFPESADLPGIPRGLETISDGKSQFELVDGFFGLVERVDG